MITSLVGMTGTVNAASPGYVLNDVITSNTSRNSVIWSVYTKKYGKITLTQGWYDFFNERGFGRSKIYWKHEFYSQASVNAVKWTVEYPQQVWPRIDDVGNPDGYVFVKWFDSTYPSPNATRIAVFTNGLGQVITAYPISGAGASESPSVCPAFIDTGYYSPQY